MLITSDLVRETVNYAPDLNIAYMTNPKAACSTFKRSLWEACDARGFAASGNPHQKDNSPFARDLHELNEVRDRLNTALIFTVVRNPFSRVLSAYLDKIARRPRDAAVWYPFATRFELHGDATPTFLEFLRLLEREADPALLDPHFAPQWVATLQDFARCDFVGHMEDMDKVHSFLARQGINPSSHRPHDTEASERIKEYYGRGEEADIVRRVYARDFELFGYSHSPSELAPVRNVATPYHGRLRLILILQAFSGPHPDIRRAAIAALEEDCPAVCVDYLKIAAGIITPAEINAMRDGVRNRRILNWHAIRELAMEMLRRNRVREGGEMASRAYVLMRGDAADK